MIKYKYTPKPLLYWLIGSIIVSILISPIVFSIVVGGWFMYAMIVFCNRFNE